jgi:N-acetylglucosamine-6-sulfatase
VRRPASIALRAMLAAWPLGIFPATASAQEPIPEPPDVVLIVTDDQRFDTLWAMPTVSERLVGAGVSFPDAFVVNPLCCPSRASILTGNHSHTHLVYRQAPPFGRFEWFDDDSTLATWLDGAGYRTGLFGKYVDGYQHAALTGYVPPGWDRWVAFVRAAATDYSLTIDGDVRRFGDAPEEHSTVVLAELAVSFVEESDGPLFLVFATASPHAPATPVAEDAGAFAELPGARPASFDEPDVSDKPAWVRDLPPLSGEQEDAIDELRRQEYRSLLGVDRAVGRILDALEAAGRLEHTLVILTSDNGLLHGEHRWAKKEAPYEEAIRVPLVLRWDAAGWEAGTELPGVFALNIDLAPTIADAARASRPATEGASLLAPLDGDLGGWREDFLIEHMEGTNPVPTYCAVRSARWKYVRYAIGEEELYDLDSDPFELENLAASAPHAGVLDEQRSRLRELCSPPPPGFDDDGASAVLVAVGALALLVLLEIASVRRMSGRRRGDR